jgi:hypothetical protein
MFEYNTRKQRKNLFSNMLWIGIHPWLNFPFVGAFSPGQSSFFPLKPAMDPSLTRHFVAPFRLQAGRPAKVGSSSIQWGGFFCPFRVLSRPILALKNNC